MIHTKTYPDASAGPSLTIREMLELEAMTGAQVLAGAKGLGREVRSATVIDAPDGTQWTREYEFLMTSTFPLAALGPQLEPLIVDLAARGISGLGVKLTRYMKELPQPVLDAADRLGFPIVSLPDHMPWVDLINPILTNALSRRADQLRRSEAIYGGFTDSLISSSRLDDLARLLAEMVGNPVVIDCEAEGISAWSDTAQGAGGFLARLREIRGREGHCLNAAHRVERHNARAGSLVCASLADEVGGGHIAIFEQNRPFNDSDLDCLLHARKACSIKVLQLSAERQVQRTRESDLLSALVTPFSNRSEHRKVVQAAQEAGHGLDGPHIVITCRIEDVAQHRMYEVIKASHVHLIDRQDILIGFPHPGLATLIVSRCERMTQGDVVALLTELHSRLAAQVPGLRLTCGVSHRLADPAALPGGFVQAEQARRFGEGAQSPCAIHWFEEVGLLRLLLHPAIQAEAHNFVEDWLSILTDHDARRDSQLVATLAAYLETNGNHRKAAERLDIHHNSIRYRMQMIRKLTGHDVMTPGIRLQYDLALALLRMQDRQIPPSKGRNPSASRTPDRAPAPEYK